MIKMGIPYIEYFPGLSTTVLTQVANGRDTARIDAEHGSFNRIRYVASTSTTYSTSEPGKNG